MADIFQEIDEDLRRDKAKEWWKRYGKFVIAGIATILIAVAAVSWWQDRKQAERLEAADRYARALATAEDGNAAEAANRLNAAAVDMPGGYTFVSLMQAAALRADEGDYAGAAETYSRIAAMDKIDPLYRDLAVVLSTLHESKAGGDAAALLERIEPQTESGKPWRYTAREVAASLALSIGDKEAAKTYLAGISDDAESPVDIRTRATEMLRAIGE